MQVGLFFGSFNPIHTGHMIIASTMIENTDIDQVWFIVSPQNPLKSSKSLIHEFDRLDMVERAIYDNYNLRASDVEFHMPRPSYTVDTLAYLRDKYPQHNFQLIIGEDNLRSFPKWKNHQVILDEFGLYVYPRPKAGGEDRKQEEVRKHPHVKMVNLPLLDISATFIRNCVRRNKSIRYLVPDAVERYIREKKLYSF